MFVWFETLKDKERLKARDKKNLEAIRKNKKGLEATRGETALGKEGGDEETAKEAPKKLDSATYYLKRNSKIQGPFVRKAILQAAAGKKLLSGDQIANCKDGPWQDITKEQLQQMQQGNDVTIK